MIFTPTAPGKRTTRLTVRGTLLMFLAIIGAILAAFLGSGSFVALCITIAILVVISLIGQRLTPPLRLRGLHAIPAQATVGEEVSLKPVFASRRSEWIIGLIPDPHLSWPMELSYKASAFKIWLSNHGIFTPGIVTGTRTNVFGFAKTTVKWELDGELVVYPEIFDLPLPAPPTASDGTPRRASSSADEAVLRPYVPGDEIRRVHWPASARQGELMVRNDSSSLTQRLDLIIDTRPQHQTGRIGQFLISAAASVGCAALASRWTVRVITSHGNRMDHLPTFARRNEFLDFIVRLRASSSTDLPGAIASHDIGNPTAAFLANNWPHAQQAIESLRQPLITSVFTPDARSRVLHDPAGPIIEFSDMTGFISGWSEIYGGGK